MSNLLRVHTYSDEARQAFLNGIEDAIDGHMSDETLSSSEVSKEWEASGTSEHDAVSLLTDDEEDDDDDDDSIPVAPIAERALIAAPDPPNAGPCPICFEEVPYVGDDASTHAMVRRMNDFRRQIFEYEVALRGRMSDDTIFTTMLDLRRTLVERHLETYSHVRFRRWTLPMLRAHYSTENGHRYDEIRIYDKEINRLSQLSTYLEEHATFVDNKETGERMFNPRSIDQAVRLNKALTDTLKAKAAALRIQQQTAVANLSSVMDAVSTSARMVASSKSATDSATESYYDLGGM